MSGALLYQRRAAGLLLRVAAALIVLVVLGPLLWGLSTSVKTEVMAVRLPPSLIPSPLTVANYLDVFRDQSFVIDLWNSIAYAFGGVIVAMLVGIPAGYAAARFEFRAKHSLMLVILATSMVPGVALLVPTYYVLNMLGLLNNRFVVIVLLAARITPQTIWFLQSFILTVPLAIEESASVDGASRLQILLRLVLPLIRPGLGAVAIIGIVTIWNDYITVAVFAPDMAKRTLQVALVDQVFNTVGISWCYMMAFAITSSLPIMIMFGVVQKWFITGLTAGAVKG
jgi:ABC-type glycerol-3-phosphate transport system permease component